MKKISAIMLVLVLVMKSSVLLGMGVATQTKKIYAQDETIYKTTLRGGNEIEVLTERINFHRRESLRRLTNPALPSYGVGFNCGATSGAIIIAYFNRIFPTLIPGHVAGMQLGNHFIWAPELSSPLLLNMFSEIHQLMGGQNGVTQQMFLSGLTTYVTSRGLSFGTTIAHTGPNHINLEFINSIQHNRPVAMFFRDSFNIVENMRGIERFPDHDIVRLTQLAGNHVMTAYGYYMVQYFDVNNRMFRQDTYLYINSGFGELVRTRINTHTTISNAFSINIW